MEELGRLLFWDPILSGARDVACATCHHPAFAYADGRELSLGTGAVGLGPERVDGANGRAAGVRRNSPTVLNTGFNGLGRGRRARRRRGRIARRAFDGTVASVDQASAPMFWDNRVSSLEAQALEPIKASEEMRGTAYAEQDAVASVVARLQGIPDYVARFEGVFGTPAIQPEYLGRAIAAFERSLYDEGHSENPYVSNERGRRGDGATPRVDGRFRRIRDMDDGAMQDIIAFLGALTDEGFDRQIPAKVPSGLQVGGQIGE
jgi:cytochrome c peroxidase